MKIQYKEYKLNIDCGFNLAHETFIFVYFCIYF